MKSIHPSFKNEQTKRSKTKNKGGHSNSRRKIKGQSKGRRALVNPVLLRLVLVIRSTTQPPNPSSAFLSVTAITQPRSHVASVGKRRAPFNHTFYHASRLTAITLPPQMERGRGGGRRGGRGGRGRGGRGRGPGPDRSPEQRQQQQRSSKWWRRQQQQHQQQQGQPMSGLGQQLRSYRTQGATLPPGHTRYSWGSSSSSDDAQAAMPSGGGHTPFTWGSLPPSAPHAAEPIRKPVFSLRSVLWWHGLN